MSTVIIARWIFAIMTITLCLVGILYVTAAIRRRAFVIPPILNYQEGAFTFIVLSRIGEPTIIAEDYANAFSNGNLKDERIKSNSSAEKSNLGGINFWNWGAAAADGLVPALEVWQNWASIDSHIFRAFEHLSHQQIDSMADLLKVVDIKNYAIESSAFANKLLGHLGEWHIQEHLTDSGLDVSMPWGTNHPGLDMWVGGHALNVKTVADAGAAASSHFDAYPDVPIIVPFDSANIPAEALHFDPKNGLDYSLFHSSSHLTLVDDALSHAELANNVDNAMDVVSDPGPHIGFPWMTAAVSSFREANLLIDGNTDLSRAVKNVIVDTAVVGGGMAVGAKTGVLIGTSFGPVGSVIGGIAGGLIGSLGGRAMANSIKREPLELAMKNYNEAVATYKNKQNELANYAAKQWESTSIKESKKLSDLGDRYHQERDEMVHSWNDKIHKEIHLEREAASLILGRFYTRIDSILRKESDRLSNRMPKWAMVWTGFWAPKEAQEFKEHTAQAHAWKKKATHLLANWGGTTMDIAQCYDLILACPGGSIITDQYLLKIVRMRYKAIEEIGRSHQIALKHIAEQRHTAFCRLKIRWNELVEYIENEIKPTIHFLKKAGEEYRLEIKKAGIGV